MIRLSNTPSLEDYHAILEFDISGLTESADQAFITLIMSPTDQPPFLSTHTIEVFGYTGNGSFDVFADFAEGSLITSFDHFDAAVVTFDVTDFINTQIALDDPLHFAGFVLGLSGPTPGRERFAFGSGLDVSPLNPSLTATTIPEPSTFALFAIGLAGLGVMTRHRRNCNISRPVACVVPK